MKLALAVAAFSLGVSQASAQATESAFGQTPAFHFEHGAAGQGGGVQAKPMCEVKPLAVPAVPLPDENAFLRSQTVFDVAGMRIHMSGSKDPANKDLGGGWYYAFYVEGDPTIYWMPASRKRQDKEIHGHMFHAEVSLWGGIMHHERIKIKISDDEGFQREVTTGELGWNAVATAPAVKLNGKTYRLVYSRIIQGRGAEVTLLEDHSVTLTSFDKYEDGGKTYYKWDDDKLVFKADALQAGYAIKTLNKKPYGFRIKNSELEIADLTAGDKSLPPCP